MRQAFNPYRYSVDFHSHTGDHFDPSSGSTVGFTAKANVEFVRRYRRFTTLFRGITASDIGPYEQTGKRWLKRAAGHVEAADHALDQCREALEECVQAAGTCQSLLEGKTKIAQVAHHQHPWVRGTIDFLTSLQRSTLLLPGQREALLEPLRERFRLASLAARNSLEHHASRTGPDSSHRYNRNATLLNLRIIAANQVNAHFGWTHENGSHSVEMVRMALKSLVKKHVRKFNGD